MLNTENRLLGNDKFQVIVNTFKLPVSDSCKFFCLVIDSKLTFTQYVTFLIRKAYLTQIKLV